MRVLSPASRSLNAANLPLVLKFGGRWVALRLLRSDDEGRLIEFFHSHTAETIYARYGFFRTQMSHESAMKLVSVDQTRDAALGVFEPGERASLIAVGRYCLADDSSSAELAFVVREDRRGLGIATMLLRVLIAIAGKRGLLRLTAQVHAANAPMLSVFRKEGAAITSIPGTGAVDVTLALRAKKDRGHRSHCGPRHLRYAARPGANLALRGQRHANT